MKFLVLIRFFVLASCWLLGYSAAAQAQLTPEVIEAAKKEREVVLYGAVTIKASKPIGDLFEKKYGIKLKHWRGDATQIINRINAEGAAGKPTFDVVLGNEAVMASIDQKGYLAVFDPPAARGVPKEFRDADHRMTPWRVLPYGINFNTQILKANEAPKSFEELLEPKWKGKLALANPGIHVTTLQFVLSLEKIVGSKWQQVVEGWAKQEPRLARGLAENIQPLTAGEVPVAISYIKDKYQYNGPIDYVRMKQYLASLSFVGVNRQAPHSNAARLFADFFLGAEPQKVFGDLGEYVFNPEVEHKFKNDVKTEQIVVMRLPSNDEMKSWSQKFRELFK